MYRSILQGQTLQIHGAPTLHDKYSPRTARDELLGGPLPAQGQGLRDGHGTGQQGGTLD